MADPKVIKKRIEDAIRRYARASSSRAYSLVPTALTSGKLYEAHVLSKVLEHLHIDENYRIILVNSNLIPLKSGGGPINPKYPHFDLMLRGKKVAELWTDITFLTLSYSHAARSATQMGDYHELDIVIVDPGITGRPTHRNIWLGVECKNTSAYTKELLKSILGIRRELSLLADDQSTHFSNWPRASVPANPASCLLVYSTDPAVLNYASPGDVFGIDFVYEPI